MTRPNMFETPIMLNTQLVWPFKGSDWMKNHFLIMVKGSYVLGYRAFKTVKHGRMFSIMPTMVRPPNWVALSGQNA